MKKRISEEILFLSFITLIFVVLSILSVTLLRGKKERDELLIEYQASKIATGLLETFKEEGYLSEETFGDDIKGFGIYNFDGTAILRYGTAPSVVDVPLDSEEASQFSINHTKKTVVLKRLTGFIPGRMPMHGSRIMGRQMMRPGIMGGQVFRGSRNEPQFLFLELKTEEFLKNQRYFQLGSILVPVLIGFTIGSLGYLLRKNIRYRKKIETQERLVQLGEIARTLSHEIKNPLSAIRIQAGILKKTLPPDKIEDIKIIEDEVEHLRSLTDRIGDFLKNPAGNPEVINVREFLNMLIQRFGENIRFSTSSMEDEDIYIKFDPERLRSVMENIIKNAKESMEDNGTEAEVEIALSASRSKVEISVLDRGYGISPEIANKIFDPFFTTKTDGSGIGLAISRRFVESAGGSLTLSPRKDGGTEAKIVLARVSNEDTYSG